jgi:hypothetical protein
MGLHICNCTSYCESLEELSPATFEKHKHLSKDITDKKILNT